MTTYASAISLHDVTVCCYLTKHNYIHTGEDLNLFCGPRVIDERVTVPPATKPDSPSCIATPKPPSFTGAEFSFEASSTQ